MNTQTMGNIGLGKAIGYFTEHGYTVSIPLNDSQGYDLIVDNGKLFRVEVKTSDFRLKSGSHQVNLKTISVTKNHQITKLFDKSKSDLLFIYLLNGDTYIIPTKKITVTNAITVGNKYEEYRVR